MIQSVITRMASNQFTARKWSVGLGTAIIGWSVAGDGHPDRAIVALLPVICFWLMDGYYLSLERRFRHLYNSERAKGGAVADFSLDPGWKHRNWPGGLIRPAVLLVHVPAIVLAYGVWKLGWLH